MPTMIPVGSDGQIKPAGDMIITIRQWQTEGTYRKIKTGAMGEWRLGPKGRSGD